MIENSITEVWETPMPPDLRCHQCRATGVYLLFTRWRHGCFNRQKKLVALLIIRPE